MAKQFCSGNMNTSIMSFQIWAKMDRAENSMQTKSTDCLCDTPRLLLFESNPRAGDQNQVYEAVNKQNEH